MAGGALHPSTCWYYHFGFPSLAGDMELNTDTLVPKQNSGNIWSPRSLNLQPIKLGTSPALFSFPHGTEVEKSGALVVLIEELTRSQGIENCWNPKQKRDSKMGRGPCTWEGGRPSDLRARSGERVSSSTEAQKEREVVLSWGARLFIDPASFGYGQPGWGFVASKTNSRGAKGSGQASHIQPLISWWVGRGGPRRAYHLVSQEPGAL